MNQSVQTIEQRIEARIDNETTRQLAVSDRAGGLVFANVSEVMEFAKLMAISGIAVRKHLRGNPGACLGVVIQALEWRMSPYAVANKSYLVNDQLAYEAQLIHAVVLSRAPIKGRPKVEYRGEGDERQCKVSVELNDGSGQWVDYELPKFGKITPKNSPLWKSDPDQQHFYFSARSLARRHFPDVILGVYAEDEIMPRDPSAARDVTPAPKTLAGKLDALAGAQPQPEHDPETGEIKGDPAGAPAGAGQRAVDPSGQEDLGGAVRGQPRGHTREGTERRMAEDEARGQQQDDQDDGRFPPADEPFPGDLPSRSAEDIAYQMGVEAKRAGQGTRALPGEFRDPAREAEKQAWIAGHTETPAPVEA